MTAKHTAAIALILLSPSYVFADDTDSSPPASTQPSTPDSSAAEISELKSVIAMQRQQIEDLKKRMTILFNENLALENQLATAQTQPAPPVPGQIDMDRGFYVGMPLADLLQYEKQSVNVFSDTVLKTANETDFLIRGPRMAIDSEPMNGTVVRIDVVDGKISAIVR